MKNITLYGTEVAFREELREKFGEEEMGLYEPVNMEGLTPNICFDYVTLGTEKLEEMAETLPRDQFLDKVKEIRDTALDQFRGKIGNVGPTLLPRDFYERKRNLGLTYLFCHDIVAKLQ